MIERARTAPYISIDTQGVVDPRAPQTNDPLRTSLIGLSIAIGTGEAYYFPLAHRSRRAEGQVGLGFDELTGGGDGPTEGDGSGKRGRVRKVIEPGSIAARALAQGAPPPTSLPPLDSDELAPLRALLEDPAVNKAAQDAKYSILLLRRSGITLRGLDFDTMVASYVLDPGRRSPGLDLLALEFLEHKTTSFEDLCGLLHGLRRAALRQGEGGGSR